MESKFRKASWLSSGIDTAQGFRNIHSMPLMRNKNELIDYVDGLYYLAGEQTYNLKPDLRIEQIENDSIHTILKRKLDRFKQINRFVCGYNNLYPDTLPNTQHFLYNYQDDSMSLRWKLTISTQTSCMNMHEKPLWTIDLKNHGSFAENSLVKIREM